MDWRIIVTFSLDDDKYSKARKDIAEWLETTQWAEYGFRRKSTSTWESRRTDGQRAASILSKMFEILADPQSVNGTSATAALDHVWIYIDRASDD